MRPPGRRPSRRRYPSCAWIALAHGFRHPGAFRGVGDRFLDHSSAGAGQHRSAADPAGGPPRNPVLAAVAATVGSILGGYLTWGTGSKGGEAALHRYLPKRFSQAVVWLGGEKWHASRCQRPRLLPPPFPLMPMLLAAGALGVSRRKFLVSFSLTRAFRYAMVAWLAAIYGRAMVRAFRHYLAGWSTTIMWIYLGLVAAGICYGVWKFRRDRGGPVRAPQEQPSAPSEVTEMGNRRCPRSRLRLAEVADDQTLVCMTRRDNRRSLKLAEFVIPTSAKREMEAPAVDLCGLYISQRSRQAPTVKPAPTEANSTRLSRCSR